MRTAIVSVVFVVGLVCLASGQPEPSARTQDTEFEASALPTLESKLGEARTNLAVAEALGVTAYTNAPAGVPLQEIVARRAMLSRLVRLLEQQLSNATEFETTKNRRAELTRKAQSWTRFDEPPPYSILLSDRLREELQTEQAKSASDQAALSSIEQLVEDSRKELTQAEERVRQLNEELEGAKDPGVVARLSWRKDLERLRGKVAAASVGVLESERRLRTATLEEGFVRIGLLQRQLVIADAGATFSQADLDTVTGRIEADRLALERELSQTQVRLAAAATDVAAARQDLHAQEGNRADPGATAPAAETLAAREAQLQTLQSEIRMLRLMLESQSVERALWEMRFAASNRSSVDTLNESERRLRTFSNRLNLWRDFQQQQMQVWPAQIEVQEARLKGLPPDSNLVPLVREHLGALREGSELLHRLVRRMDQLQRLSQRWGEELRVAEARLAFVGRIQTLFADARSFGQKLWAFELFTAEDTIMVEGQKITGKRSVTLGKIVLAVLILVLGVWITGVISRFTEPIIVRRLKIEVNQAKLIRRWFRALLVVCLVLLSLISVKIPLTVFAFAGGALAIGLGFGTQTLLKNFVSGLILLFERPFRVGDVLEVAGNRGTVTEIGLRASVLHLWDGTETLIPNSSLLENNVSNWTYSSPKVRFSVAVGAAYGSDIRRVLQLLTEVVERHGLVEREPKPQAFFTDFADSALTFELRYWVDVIRANPAQVGSDLRQMIAGAFAENSIVIAFPQRDLHLDAAQPLPVRLVTSPAQPPQQGIQEGGKEPNADRLKL